MNKENKIDSIEVKRGIKHRNVADGRWINNYISLIEFDWFCYVVIHIQKTGDAHSTSNRDVNVTHTFTYFENYSDALKYMESISNKLTKDYYSYKDMKG